MVNLAMMAITNNKYKIIEEDGKEYIFASQVSDYIRERLHTSFGVPSYRTIRYYVTNGVLERPLKRGKETYFDADRIVSEIDLIRRLQPLNPPLNRLQDIVPNVRRYGEWEETYKVLESDATMQYIKCEGKGKFFDLLATKKPSDIIYGRRGSGKSYSIKNIGTILQK